MIMIQVSSEALTTAIDMFNQGVGKGEILDFILDNIFDDEELEDE